MYNVSMYKDARGKCQVCQLINLLDEESSKQSKGALKKIYYQIARIERKGTRAGEGWIYVNILDTFKLVLSLCFKVYFSKYVKA